MKHLVLFIALLIASVLIAQTDNTTTTDNEFKTLFHNNGGKTKVSGFGSVNLDFGSVENNFGLMLGGEGALLLNQRFYIGFYGRGLTTLPKYELNRTFNNNIVNIERRGMLGHGGLLIGFIFMPEKPIHFGIDARIGGGAVGLVYYYESYYNDPDLYYPEDRMEAIFAFAPEAYLEMNFTSWFKVKLSAGYQYISNASVKAPIIENGKLVYDDNNKLVTEEVFNTTKYRTPTLSLGFVFGWFK